MLTVVMLTVVMLTVVMLTVVMLTVVMLTVVMLTVVMLSGTGRNVVAPHFGYFKRKFVQDKVNFRPRKFQLLQPRLTLQKVALIELRLDIWILLSKQQPLDQYYKTLSYEFL